MYLKYFSDIRVESVYNDKGVYHKKTFDFIRDNTIIQNENDEVVDKMDLYTTISLSGLKRDYQSKLDKKTETIARKLLEKLLVYFVLDNYSCPTVVIQDPWAGDMGEIVLNDYLDSEKGIVQVQEMRDFVLASDDNSAREKFGIKVFKIYYGGSRSSVNLVADHRLVTDEALYSYIPEFRGDFYDEAETAEGQKTTKGFTIRAYVFGDYLDNNVSIERDSFDFQDSNDLFYAFSRKDIERRAAAVVSEIFGSNVKTKREKKISDIREYVEERAPWHRTYLNEIDLDNFPVGLTDVEMENELQKSKNELVSAAQEDIGKVLNQEDSTSVSEKTQEIVSRITEMGKSDLVHYIALRKSVLDLFKKSLEWNDDLKHEKEKVLHDIIFPTRKDSDSLPYEYHNLWILDEKLSFSEYVASDMPIGKKDGRPDLVVFDKKVAFRSGEGKSNPIIVFEFKKPQRESYDKNPLKQLEEYISKIRAGGYQGPKGREILADMSTPAYGFLVCDINSPIRAYCKEYSLTESSDGRSFYGFHVGHNIYYEVVSFDKLVIDSELRNKIFFHKLGLE